MLWEERVSRVFLHAFLKRRAGFPPHDWVGVVHNDLVTIRDIDSSGWISRDIDLNDSVVLVEYIKVNMGE